MSNYIQDLGALPFMERALAKATALPTGVVSTKFAIPKAPAPGMVWVPPTSTVGGHWERKKATSGRRATVSVIPTSAMTVAQRAERAAQFRAQVEARRTAEFTQRCIDTGMPAELVPQCVEGLRSGASMEEVGAALQAGVSAPDAAAPGRSKLLLYGGAAAAAGLVLLLLLRKKKR